MCVTKAEKVSAPTKPIPDTGSSSALSDKEQLCALNETLQKMQQEIMRLKAAGSNAPPPVPRVNAKGPDPAPEVSDDEDDGQVDKAKFNTAKQKLRRMTRPRQNGSYIVPSHIVQKFDAGGAERKALVKILIDNNMDKDGSTRQSV